MVGILDVRKVTKSVPVGSVKVDVSGLSLEGIAALMNEFPEIKQAFGAGANFTVESLVALLPAAVAKGIAYATEGGTLAEREAHITGLPVGVQVDLLSAVLNLTAPQGIGPLVAAVTGLMGTVTGTATGIKGQASK